MLRELNSRETSYGLSVALLWDDSTDSTYIEMETDTDWSRFEIHSEDAASAFDHPFVFQARALERDSEFHCMPKDNLS